ncbi:hypothetical protein [Niallia endozanthoxylica]|uniref:hypothetical protein n=1 Tax=Niallia endozanthoxylica TaxID=2036016 RepID=UPI00168B6268|nr:hypothetical protein [Niallia endozanthoxylica]
MYREGEMQFTDFVAYDQFELKPYLSYLFQRFYEHASNQSEEKRLQLNEELVLK